jgi:hypothetical protein
MEAVKNIHLSYRDMETFIDSNQEITTSYVAIGNKIISGNYNRIYIEMLITPNDALNFRLKPVVYNEDIGDIPIPLDKYESNEITVYPTIWKYNDLDSSGLIRIAREIRVIPQKNIKLLIKSDAYIGTPGLITYAKYGVQLY